MAGDEIRYTRAADGTSIAYWAVGSGPTVLRMNYYESAIETEQQLPGYRSFLEDLARDMRIVRFDPRGHGLSAWAPGRYTPADFALDITAVADAVGGAPVMLWTRSFCTGAAIEWAHRRPTNALGSSSGCLSLEGASGGIQRRTKRSNRPAPSTWR